MTVTASLYQRRRAPSPDELAGIPWLRVLQPAERDHAVRQLVVTEAEPGEYVCRVGRPVTFWFGVIEGLLKEQLDAISGLAEKGLYPRLRVVAVERQLSDLAGDIQQARARREAAEAALAEAKSRYQLLEREQRSSVLAELAAARAPSELRVFCRASSAHGHRGQT